MSSEHHPQLSASTSCQKGNNENESFWKQPSGSSIIKLPGRVMKQNSLQEKAEKAMRSNGGSKPGTPTKGLSSNSLPLQMHQHHQQQQQHNQRQNHQQHKKNNSASFEVFTASCDDAWDSNLEDCLSGTNSKNSKDKYLGTSSSSSSSSSGSSSFAQKSYSQQTKNSNNNNNNTNLNASSSSSSSGLSVASNQESDPKLTKLKRILFDDEVTDLNQLRSLAWAGVPNQVRPITWKLLLGYLPVIRAKREQVLERKRSEYQNLVEQYYNNRSSNDEIWRQIHIDIPRMQPLISIFQQPLVQGIFERILYIWSIRHPASGYVQGMNDLVTPFFVTYLSEFIPGNELSKVESFEVSRLTIETLQGVEADSFWSFTKLLDSIQDNYTFAQPGIQHLVNLLACVVSRVDRSLHEHLEKHNVQYLQFAFRWMNNLLIREIPLRCIVRLWDTYLSEGAVTTTALPTQHSTAVATLQDNSTDSNNWTMGSGTPFSSAFHLYVCAAFLRFWSKNLLQEKDFQGLMLLLQNLPTFHWTDKDITLLVADAYQLKYTFSPNHLKI